MEQLRLVHSFLPKRNLLQQSILSTTCVLAYVALYPNVPRTWISWNFRPPFLLDCQKTCLNAAQDGEPAPYPQDQDQDQDPEDEEQDCEYCGCPERDETGALMCNCEDFKTN